MEFGFKQMSLQRCIESNEKSLYRVRNQSIIKLNISEFFIFVIQRAFFQHRESEKQKKKKLDISGSDKTAF